MQAVFVFMQIREMATRQRWKTTDARDLNDPYHHFKYCVLNFIQFVIAFFGN